MGPLFTWLDRFGKGKEGWLFLTLLLYPAGYLATSYYYWKIGLGSVPLLDKQYFVAGIAPVAAILVGKVLSDIADRLAGAFNSKLSEADARRSSGISAAATSLTFSGIALVLWVVVASMTLLSGSADVILAVFNTINSIPSVYLAQIVVAWLLLYFLALALPFNTIKGLFGLACLLVTPAITVVIPLVVLLRFMDGVYPQLPSEFGGAMPQCAYVDLTRDQVSDEMWAELVADPATLPTSVKVKRSVLLNVYSSGKDSMTVKRADSSTGDPSRYEIRGNAAQSITWVRCL